MTKEPFACDACGMPFVLGQMVTKLRAADGSVLLAHTVKRPLLPDDKRTCEQVAAETGRSSNP